jgi:hypothetical protein
MMAHRRGEYSRSDLVTTRDWQAPQNTLQFQAKKRFVR